MKKYFSSLKHRDFRLFWSGQVVSLSGSWMQNMAQGWLVLQITNSHFLLGLVNAIAALPILFFSLVGGAVADKVHKRKLIILTQISSMLLAFTIGVLISSKLITFWQIAIAAGLLGVVNAFDMPARHSIVIEMVGKDDLPNAIALNALIFNIARIIGPGIAGLIVGSLGVEYCFYINGISFLAVIPVLLFIRDNSTMLSNNDSMREAIFEGANYVLHDTKMRALIILIAVSSLFGVSYMVLLPIFARDILTIGPQGLGMLMVAIGVGALLASFTMAVISHLAKQKYLILAGGSILGLSLLLFGISKNTALSIVSLIGIGWGLVTQTATINSLLQVCTPDHLRGRVMGFYTFMFLGMTPIGSFQAGTVSHFFGAPASVILGGCICFLMTIFFSRTILKN